MLTEPHRPSGVPAHRVRRWDADPAWPGFPADQVSVAAADTTAGESIPIAVRVFADDPVTRDAMLACLRVRPEIRVLSGSSDAATHSTTDAANTADAGNSSGVARVVLVLAEWITDETLDRVQKAAATAPGAGFVLVGDGLREHHLLGALAHGPLSVIARRDADADRVVRAIVGLPQGRLDLPAEAVGWLVTRLRTIHRCSNRAA